MGKIILTPCQLEVVQTNTNCIVVREGMWTIKSKSEVDFKKFCSEGKHTGVLQLNFEAPSYENGVYSISEISMSCNYDNIVSLIKHMKSKGVDVSVNLNKKLYKDYGVLIKSSINGEYIDKIKSSSITDKVIDIFLWGITKYFDYLGADSTISSKASFSNYKYRVENNGILVPFIDLLLC